MNKEVYSIPFNMTNTANMSITMSTMISNGTVPSRIFLACSPLGVTFRFMLNPRSPLSELINIYGVWDMRRPVFLPDKTSDLYPEIPLTFKQ